MAALPSSSTIETAKLGSDGRLDQYIIGSEDVLAVNIWKEPEISRTVPVRPDGKITLPLIGDIQASGLTPRKLQDNITNGLRSYLSTPEVTVIVQEVKSLKFNIVGEIARPGSYTLSQPMTVLDAIAVGGGLRDFAKGSRIYVLRSNNDGSRGRLPFDYKQVIKGKKLSENVELRPGDTIVVP
jgi:polysaccharide export outer membrane protein